MAGRPEGLTTCRPRSRCEAQPRSAATGAAAKQRAGAGKCRELEEPFGAAKSALAVLALSVLMSGGVAVPCILLAGAPTGTGMAEAVTFAEVPVLSRATVPAAAPPGAPGHPPSLRGASAAAASAVAAAAAPARAAQPAAPPAYDGILLPSGLAYERLQLGSAERGPQGGPPGHGSRVRVRYNGHVHSFEGPVFDSSFLRGQRMTPKVDYAELTLGADRSYPMGLHEAMALMRVGERGRFTQPPALGYTEGTEGFHGESSQVQRMPTNSVLYYDVELLDMVRA